MNIQYMLLHFLLLYSILCINVHFLYRSLYLILVCKKKNALVNTEIISQFKLLLSLSTS